MLIEYIQLIIACLSQLALTQHIFQNLFSLFSHLSLTFFYVYKYDNDVDDGDNEKIFSAMRQLIQSGKLDRYLQY